MPAAPTLDQDPRSGILCRGIAELGLDCSPAQAEALLRFLDLLERWNRHINLTAVRDPGQMVGLHLLDCLAPLPSIHRYLEGSAPRVLDVGSGAGLPGLVWAVMHPDWTVTCVDTVGKKAGFIRQAAGDLGLVNLQAVHARVEQFQPEPAPDLVVCRAYATLDAFVRSTRHLLAPRGCWLAMKGAVPAEEITHLPADIEVFHVEQLTVPRLDAQRCLVWLRPRQQKVG